MTLSEKEAAPAENALGKGEERTGTPRSVLLLPEGPLQLLRKDSAKKKDGQEKRMATH